MVVDQDCDGFDGTVSSDTDGDGFDDVDDCQPFDPSIDPGAPEIPGDGIDQNCDGVDDIIPYVQIKMVMDSHKSLIVMTQNLIFIQVLLRWSAMASTKIVMV